MALTGYSYETLDGMRVSVRLPHRTHEYWAVNRNHKTGEWSIQRAGRVGCGTHFDPPLPEHKGFKTKKEAQEYKRVHLK